MGNKCFMNRELSWIKFNERVLEEAADRRNPLCERLNFSAIYGSNLDEFFMVRVGSLIDRINAGAENDDKTNMSCKEQLDAVLAEVRCLSKEKDSVYLRNMEELAGQGVELINFRSLSQEDAFYLSNYFANEIKPLISPQIVGKRQPFPFLQNQKIYAIVALETKNMNEKIGIIPCSGVFNRLIAIPSDNSSENKRYMLVEELILHFASRIFNRYKVKSKTLIRINRNADIDADEAMYDYDIDYREAMSEIIKNRTKLRPVMMEYTREVSEGMLKTICKYIGIKEKQTYISAAPLDLSFVYEIRDFLKNRHELFYDEFSPCNSEYVDENRSMIAQIKENDILLSYPYESMRPFLRLLREAGQDENVVSIKMTLYRVAKYSKVVEALIDAAENGKEVIVLVELRARFDESNNIEWSRRMEDAGCRIIYGLDGIKVHSKLCLITRRQNNKIEYITQIGTGNYNEKTAKLYTDLSLMTADAGIGCEVMEVFNELSMGQTVEETNQLLVAPKCLQNKIIAMIDDEIEIQRSGGQGYVGAKMNALTDKKIMEKLIEASQAGVKIELVIRGICCLLPGIPGYTENIRVISIVGRFLEHSRIYIFGTPEREKIYISSADYMTRNTLKRVEVAAPLLDSGIKARVRQIFEVMLHDNVKARELHSDGTYVHAEAPEGTEEVNSQKFFCIEAKEREYKREEKQ